MSRAVDSGIILIARLALSVLFLWSGIMKVFGYGAFVGYLQTKGVPFVQVAAAVATAVEVIGGIFLVIGLFIRPLGLIMAIYTIASAIIGHDFWNVTDAVAQHDMVIHFWKNVGIAGGFLLLIVTGAGGASVDAARAPRRPSL